MKNEKNLPKNWLNILLSVLSFIALSCSSSGPKIETCIIGTGNAGQCHDERLAKDKRDYVRPKENMVNYVAISSSDYHLLMTKKCEGVEVEICILSTDGHGECYDPKDDEESVRPPSAMLNYVATGVKDYEYLLKYLENKCDERR